MTTLLLVASAAACDGNAGDLCTESSCADGEVCDPITGECLAIVADCSVNSDCEDESKKCLDGACVPKCYDVTCDSDHGEVCDPDTGECVGGNACEGDDDCEVEGTFCQIDTCVGAVGAECSPTEPCADGLDCISNAITGFCAAPCQAHSDCGPFERCLLDNPEAGAYENHCQFNVCRPGGNPEVDGFQDAEYMGPCNVAAVGDGICIGPIALGADQGGICLAQGTALPGEVCDSTAGHESPLACNSGFCLTDETTTQGVCTELCSLFDGNGCADLFGQPAACYPAFGINGVCLTQTDPPGQPDAQCALTPGTFLACVEDYGCLPGGNGNVCQPFCDTTAGAGDPGLCAAGQCELIGADNPYLGVCIDN